MAGGGGESKQVLNLPPFLVRSVFPATTTNALIISPLYYRSNWGRRLAAVGGGLWQRWLVAAAGGWRLVAVGGGMGDGVNFGLQEGENALSSPPSPSAPPPPLLGSA